MPAGDRISWQWKLGSLTLKLRERWVYLATQLLAGLISAVLSIVLVFSEAEQKTWITVTLALLGFSVVVSTVCDKTADLHQKKIAHRDQEEILNAGYRALQPIIKMLDLLLKNTAHHREVKSDRFLFLPEMLVTLVLGLVDDSQVRASYYRLAGPVAGQYRVQEIYSSGYLPRAAGSFSLQADSALSCLIRGGDLAARIRESSAYKQELPEQGEFSEALVVPVQSQSHTYALLMLETVEVGLLTETDRLAMIVLARSAALLLETRATTP